MDTNDDILDHTKLRQCKAELGGAFPRIVGYYREDGAKAIAQIEAAAGELDAAALVRPAHTLKGDSLQFGAELLGFAAEEIEKAARDAVEMHAYPTHIAHRIASLRPLFAETVRALERELPPVAVAAMPRRVGGFGRKAMPAPHA